MDPSALFLGLVVPPLDQQLDEWTAHAAARAQHHQSDAANVPPAPPSPWTHYRRRDLPADSLPPPPASANPLPRPLLYLGIALAALGTLLLCLHQSRSRREARAAKRASTGSNAAAVVDRERHLRPADPRMLATTPRRGSRRAREELAAARARAGIGAPTLPRYTTMDALYGDEERARLADAVEVQPVEGGTVARPPPAYMTTDRVEGGGAGARGTTARPVVDRAQSTEPLAAVREDGDEDAGPATADRTASSLTAARSA
ncbi:hypothetical protein GGF31_006164 [Allomyces arbusculus]|nr:hypothetical protein GGF31_006164 [Allomyces arbusculus]